MNSSDLQRSVSTLIQSNHGSEKEAYEIILSKHVKFFAYYQPQEFSLPDSIMFYIVKNPSSADLYQKLIQTCKYFFSKNPVFVTSELVYFGDYKCELPLKHRQFDISKISSKLWITDKLFVLPEISNPKTVAQNMLSSVIPKFYQCDAKYVSIADQIISFQDLSLLVSSAVKIDFRDVTVMDENGTNVPVEKIVGAAVNAKWIEFWYEKALLNITSETMKELTKLPHFSKINELTLYEVPETFDVETFYIYMKKNKTTKIWFYFEDSISEAYNNRLEEIVDEIFTTKVFDFKPPFIGFNLLDEEKSDKLADIYFSH